MMQNFVCYFFFVGWDCISFGIHFCLSAPNFEIHIPFGFIRIGFAGKPSKIKQDEIDKRIFGWLGGGRNAT